MAGEMDANDLVQESMVTHGTNIALPIATERFNEQIKNSYTVSTIVTGPAKVRTEKYLGIKINCKKGKKSTSDHAELQIARELARQSVETVTSLPTTNSKSLFIGSTFREVKTYGNNPALFFHHHGSEGKDTVRNLPLLLGYFSKVVRDADSDLTTTLLDDNSLTMTMNQKQMKDILKQSRKLSPMNRLYADLPDKEKIFNVLHFQDSAYNVSADEMADWFINTKAYEAHIVGFFPNVFIDPTVPESEIYKYEESCIFSDFTSFYVKHFNAIYLIVSSQVPLESVEVVLIAVFDLLKTIPYNVLKGVIEGVLDTSNPVFGVFLSTLSYWKFQYVVKPLLEAVFEYLRDIVTVSKVAWKNGFQNGYMHYRKRWANWLVNGRFFLKKGLILDREVVTRFGEMYHIRLYRSNGADFLVHSLSVPEQFRGIPLLDFEKSWNPATKSFNKSLVYFNVYLNEFEEAMLWACGEPIESLDLDIVCVAISRLKSGLSISSNELVPAWRLKNAAVVKFSLIVLLETYRIKGMYNQIVEQRDFITGYEYNIEKIFKKCFINTANFLSCGFVGAAWYVYHYLVSAEKTHILVKDSYEAPITTEKPKISIKSIKSVNDAFELNPLSFVFQKQNKSRKTKCEWCSLCKAGLFGEQELICDHSESDNQKIVITKEMTLELMAAASDAEDFHRAANALKVVDAIKEIRKFLRPLLETGFTLDIVVHNLEGGPGTGKSVVAREFMAFREQQGFSTAVLSPFANLISDYQKVTLLDGTKYGDFNFKTTWRAGELKNQNVLVVEEKGAFDVLVALTIAAMNCTSEIVFLGDVKQTILQNSEGFSVCRSDAPIDWSLASSHTLRRNFRNNPYAVKILNRKLGYRMFTKRTDYKKFQFVTLAEYQVIKQRRENDNLNLPAEERKPPIEEISFADDSIKLFSTRPAEKHTVRSKQGGGYADVALALTQGDSDLLDVHGMLAVAISRSKNELYLVVHDLGDPIVTKFKTLLEINDDLDYEKEPFPEIVSNVSNRMVKKIEAVQLERAVAAVLPVGAAQDVLPENSSSYTLKEKILDKISVSEELEEDGLGHCLYKCAIQQIKPELRNNFTKHYKNFVFTHHELYKYKKEITLDGSYPAVTVSQMLDCLDVFGLPALCGTYSRPMSKRSQKRNPNYTRLNNTYRDILEYEYSMGYMLEIVYLPVDRDHCLLLSDYIRMGYSTDDLENFPETLDYKINGTYKTGTYNDIYGGKMLMEILDRYSTGELKTDLVGSKNFSITQGVLREVSGLNYVGRESFDSKVFSYVVPTANTLEEKPSTITRIVKPRPFKFGKDGYKSFFLFDKSNTYKLKTTFNQLNAVGSIIGPTKKFKTGSRILWKNFFFERTKSGKIRKYNPVVSRGFSLGSGNIFSGSKNDTLIAAQRYLCKKKTIPRSFEGLQFARSIAADFVKNNIRYLMKDNVSRATVYKKAIYDMKHRNYYNRGRAEIAKTTVEKMGISFHNKKVFKPIKNKKINIFKGGQGIAQTPAWFNYRHIPRMRLINREFKDSFKTHFYYDNLTPLDDFRRDITKAINKLPKTVDTMITDAVEFDANQNWFTVEIEKETCRLMGVPAAYIKSYYKCREPGVFKVHGLFSGKTNGEKGSGFPDTLKGNSNTSGALSDKIATGIGPKVVAAKGDDFLKIQSMIVEDYDFQREILKFCNLKFVVNISRGGEFCGDVVSRKGMYPSIMRTALKLAETKAVDYKDFTEKQISARDKVSSMQKCGIMGTVAANMYAEKRSFWEVINALNFVVSYGHINREQWESRTQNITFDDFILPGASGLQLPVVHNVRYFKNLADRKRNFFKLTKELKLLNNLNNSFLNRNKNKNIKTKNFPNSKHQENQIKHKNISKTLNLKNGTQRNLQQVPKENSKFEISQVRSIRFPTTNQ